MDRENQPQFLAESTGRTRKPSRPALLMGTIPFIAICFTVSLWDRIDPRVAGLPFNIFWLILWTLITPLCMWGAYRCEQRRAEEDPDARREDLQ